MRRINLGCGEHVLDGYENYDYRLLDRRIKYIDLNILPLPFEDNSIDEVLLSQVMEHLQVDLVEFMTEIYRILVSGGVVNLRLPTWSNYINHKHFFHTKSWLKPLVRENRTPMDRMPHFRLVSVEYTSNGRKQMDLFGFFKRFFGLLQSWCYREVNWKLKK